ncbi:MAG: hypothetical protein OHK0057_17600 [Thermoflexibacter sp.]
MLMEESSNIQEDEDNYLRMVFQAATELDNVIYDIVRKINETEI